MCSKLFGHSTIDSIIGDVLGGVGGFLVGGPAGAAIGGGLGGFAGSALGGGKLTQDLIAGAGGAAAGFGGGELAAGLGATSLGAGAADAGAVASEGGGAISAGAPSLVSDAAGGATIAEGVPLASTYGATAPFATDIAATGGLAADAGALPLATTDLASGAFGGAPVDAVTDTAGGGLGSSGASVAPGISASSPTLGANATALGAAPSTAPGPGAISFAPPPGAASGVDLTATDAAGLGGFQANVPVGTNAIGADVSGGSAFNAGPDLSGGIPSDITQSLGGVSEADPGGLPTPPTPPPGGAPAETFGQKVGDFFSPVTDTVDKAGAFLNSPTGKVLATGVSGAGLLHSLMTPNNIPGESQLTSLASQLGQSGANLIQPNALAADNIASGAHSQAQTLENYLTTGSLPGPVQASLDRATQSAITDIKAQYAAKGLPPNSSAEQQDIESARQSAIINGGSLAASLYSQGVSLDQLASQIYTGLVGAGTSAAGAGVGAQENVLATNVAQNTGVNNAIANLSSALGGGTKINISGTQVPVAANV